MAAAMHALKKKRARMQAEAASASSAASESDPRKQPAKMLKRQLTKQLTRQLTRQLTASFDKALDRRPRGCPHDIDPKVYKAFQTADTDSSGYIEAAEMVVSLKQLERTMTERQASRLVTECARHVNRTSDSNDELDVHGFSKLIKMIEEFKPTEPFLEYSILPRIYPNPALWRLMDEDEQASGAEITNDALAAALAAKKLQFKHPEQIGLRNLPAGCYIRVGRERYQPVLKPRPLPYQKEVRAAYTNPIVVWTVAAIIMANFIINILEKEYDPDLERMKFTPFWEGADVVFNILFLIELLWNMYGYGFGKRFWHSGWNVFDFIIVAVGILLMTGIDLGELSKLKLLRAFRVFRLFKRIKSLNRIIMSLIAAVPGVTNAFVILFIFFCIYAILAVEIFRNFGKEGYYLVFDALNNVSTPDFDPRCEDCSFEYVDYSRPDSTTPRGYTHGIEYYGTYTRAMLTLFQVMTGDSWAESINRPLLFGLYQNSKFFVSAYYVSFVILSSMVMSNVVIAVLLDNMVAPPGKGMTDPEVAVLIDFIKDKLGVTTPDAADSENMEPSLNGVVPFPAERASGLENDRLLGGRAEHLEFSLLQFERKLDRLAGKLDLMIERKRLRR
jgi:hypothetical protein